jgi:hypothetical protein
VDSDFDIDENEENADGEANENDDDESRRKKRSKRGVFTKAYKVLDLLFWNGLFFILSFNYIYFKEPVVKKDDSSTAATSQKKKPKTEPVEASEFINKEYAQTGGFKMRT